jgi:two-component system, chemotaxis family, sensor kinase CheA
MIEDPELRQLFKAESSEHLARLDDGLLRLEKNCSDQALLEEVFREAHSMKGAARMLGLSKIETASHGLESVLNSAYKGESPLTPAMIDRLTVMLGELRQMVREALTGAPAETQVAEAVGQVQSAIMPSPPVGHEALPPPRTGGDRDTDNPPEESPQITPPPRRQKGREKGMASEQPFRIETVRVNTRQLDDLLTLAGELSVIQGRWQHRLSLMDEMLEHWANLERGRKKLNFLLRKSDSLDRTGDAWRQTLQADGETLAQLGSKIKQTHDAFYEDGARLETTSNALEEGVHAARLLPLSSVFSLFPRMVRDLAREQRKEVELVIEGGEINVDKHVLEEMKDPLMHLLRNAIDHGIEPPVERERLGKPRSGALKLRAKRENNKLFIEVSDDGRGLDANAIRHVALQRGLQDEDELAAMTTAQLQQLIFLPGFSTSTFVTELSGRGVGLDVVRANVERLKGGIRMESTPQFGTVMQLLLPLSLSTTRLLLVSVSGHRYGLPIEFVHTSRCIREDDIFTLEGQAAFEFDGQAVISPRLADLLGLPVKNQDGETVCIVIQMGDERLGVRVDELLDEEEVLTKPLGKPLRRVRNVSGLTILSSGEICVVLNPADLLRSARKLGTTPAKHPPARTAPSIKNGILLVEDSVLVRVMEKRILEDAGYEVVAAVDGVDALNALNSRSFAAVVSDIMMPNMDGLTLTSRIRQDPRYHDMPVILVTSLVSSDDKRRGLEVGANAYIPKPSFDQNILLDTLQRLIVP